MEYDGASKSNPGPAGAGALVRRPDGSVVRVCKSGWCCSFIIDRLYLYFFVHTS